MRRDGTVGAGTSALAVDAVVCVEPASGERWTGKVIYVSDGLVGLRGSETVEGRFRERDAVTLVREHQGMLVSGRAAVLAASGARLRLVRRDGSEPDRRRAPRITTDVAVRATIRDRDDRPEHVDARVVDLSSVGCALRTRSELAVGARASILLDARFSKLTLHGVVVRTWSNDEGEPLAGVQFGLLAPSVTATLNRFLTQQLRSNANNLR